MKIIRSPGPPRGFCLSGDKAASLALRPLDPAPGGGDDRVSLAGGPLGFAAVEAFLHDGDRLTVWSTTLAELDGGAGAIERLAAPRAPFAGLALDRPRIMGIVNVTPDSFHDGGRHDSADAAIAHGLGLIEAGADILDVGGCSTRPGSTPVPEDVECDRVLPVIEALAAAGAVVSVDTYRPVVMRRALDAGAAIINDVTALAAPGAVGLVAESGAAAVLMHMLGDPATMQRNPTYIHAPYEVYGFLAHRVRACLDAGIAPGALAVDPGIGFGKTVDHNLEILGSLALLHGLGTAVLLGASRKSFISRTTGGGTDRLAGSLAAALVGAGQGAQLYRVHDVAETRQALDLWHATTLAAA
ncbi:MAG: dihydropteroate synthase [Alphaproteobacteria bacterium]